MLALAPTVQSYVLLWFIKVHFWDIHSLPVRNCFFLSHMFKWIIPNVTSNETWLLVRTNSMNLCFSQFHSCLLTKQTFFLSSNDIPELYRLFQPYIFVLFSFLYSAMRVEPHCIWQHCMVDLLEHRLYSSMVRTCIHTTQYISRLQLHKAKISRLWALEYAD